MLASSKLKTLAIINISSNSVTITIIFSKEYLKEMPT
jgi:hypothetical protein